METKKPRNIVKVIEAIEEVFKGKENDRLTREFLYYLKKVQRNSEYTPPEAMGRQWYNLALLLDNFIRPETEEGKKIGAIMRDEIDVGARDDKKKSCVVSDCTLTEKHCPLSNWQCSLPHPHPHHEDE